MPSVFLCLFKLYYRIFLHCFCILYTSVKPVKHNYMMYIEYLQRMCSIKCCFTNAKMKMNHRLRATGSPNFLLSSSKLPKLLFSCVIFSKVLILRSKRTNIWLVYTCMSYLTYQCVLSDKRDMLMIPAMTSPKCFFLFQTKILKCIR